jgi:hypothetical protein
MLILFGNPVSFPVWGDSDVAFQRIHFLPAYAAPAVAMILRGLALNPLVVREAPE